MQPKPQESQQPTGSHIRTVCTGIYRKIDKTVKMYIHSYLTLLMANIKNRKKLQLIQTI